MSSKLRRPSDPDFLDAIRLPADGKPERELRDREMGERIIPPAPVSPEVVLAPNREITIPRPGAVSDQSQD